MTDKNNEDLDRAEDENSMEDATILHLIRKLDIEPNFFNTIDWINNFHERTQDPKTELLSETLSNLLDTYPEFIGNEFDTQLRSVGLEQIANLEEQYKKIGSRVKENLPYERFFRFDNPIELFLFEISYGSYPPPEILMMLAKCFSLYFLAEGTLSLEDVFFGKVIKKSGNYSMRRKRNTNFQEFHYQVIQGKVLSNFLNKKFNLEEFTLAHLKTCQANEVSCPIVNVTEDNIESFIVAYYRWKKNNLNKQTSLIDKAEIKGDSINALVSLGYSITVAEQVILKVLNNKLTAEETIKKALMSLME
ncbi:MULTISPECIES: RuvA C-terminal domain-containing protein [unclassified Colwellia]|uniref:RuvA C-terminal domain-containing protein n=1 Tax=unclassified Colwellia TaxID=196834 RepID=UPI0015F439E0|nr:MULTISPECIES: RuvA C-terminal domain-containing protein [unclassified Colwellia]MBA6377690.1 RuvA C-terminal domain-containing protein [Colwellia sp. BRX10-7]MBA6385358.1 RuvA C-terminal domain-containing protein [Colwellia sp. BRX10-2]MBA6400267.1 RuvA C-terminal domain-containing protein [Colwellia sp. BRX10-5]MBA6404146.1 RuvA C-terminal domain-containing protein [Colwellia sp. BRX10-1]